MLLFLDVMFYVCIDSFFFFYCKVNLSPLHACFQATLPLSQSPWRLVCVSLFSPCSLRLAASTAALAPETLSSVATNSDSGTATNDPAQDSPSSETTTLTCSLSTPANDPSPAPVPAPAPTPESNPTPVLPASALKANMAPSVEQRASEAPQEEETVNSTASTPEQTRPQKSGTPIPPKRRYSPKMAALNAKCSPPVSPLATSSPTGSTNKFAQSPAVNKPLTPDDSVVIEAETPAKTAKTLERTAPPKPDPDLRATAPDSSGLNLTAPDVNKPTEQSVDNIPTAKDAASDSSSVFNGGLAEPDVDHLVAEVASPPPLTSVPCSSPPTSDSLQPPASNNLTDQADMYDNITQDVGPRRMDLDLELTRDTPADLISLDSPPSAPTLPNGDGVDLTPSGPVVEASETLAKTAVNLLSPTVNDEYGSL